MPRGFGTAGADNSGIGKSGFQSKKSFENQSMMSGGRKSDKGANVNFTLASGARTQIGTSDGKGYGIPTLKMLNPELYKEMEKQEK
jgi:hypothetical protein